MDYINKRLSIGKARYGNLNDDLSKYGWKEMANEELADAIVYTASAELQKQQKTNDENNTELIDFIESVKLTQPTEQDSSNITTIRVLLSLLCTALEEI